MLQTAQTNSNYSPSWDYLESLLIDFGLSHEIHYKKIGKNFVFYPSTSAPELPQRCVGVFCNDRGKTRFAFECETLKKLHIIDVNTFEQIQSCITLTKEFLNVHSSRILG